MIPDYPTLLALYHDMRRSAVKAPKSTRDIAYSYIRYSHGPQEEGDTIRRQTALREDWLRRNPHVVLDRTLRMADPGKTGYGADPFTDPRYALAAFVEEVKARRVLPGSYLIVENLDRLARRNPIHSIPAVLNLIGAGIRIVQLTPAEIVYDSDMDQGKLMNMLWELARGHGESKRKATLASPKWAEKLRLARQGVPHGHVVPLWLELRDGRYRLRPGTGRVIRNIFRWSAEGSGIVPIARRLNADGVPPFGDLARWTRGYVGRILSNRAALGEYQKMKGPKGDEPDGEPVPGYFEAAVTEAQWAAAQNAKAARNKRTGRPSRSGLPTSPLAGLLHCARDGVNLRVKKKKGLDVVMSATAADKMAPSRGRHFPLAHLVDGLFSQLEEVAVMDIFRDPGGTRIGELEAQLFDINRRLAVALQRFNADPESLTWADQVSACDREQRGVNKELAAARQEAACPASASWAEALQLMRRDEPARLRQCFLTAIEGIWCLFVPREPYKVAAVQVWFAGGQVQRTYLIWSFVPPGWRSDRAKDDWLAYSFAHPRDFDLRGRKDAADMARELERVKLPEFGQG
jgi:DNA invertase Pin-like site-specific DNA recombinase